MTHQPVDWVKLNKITNNRTDLANEMISMFADELPTRQQQINTALEKQDWEKLLLHIHKLHGSSAYCAATALSALSAELESQLKNKQYNNAASLVEKINEQIQLFLEMTTHE